MRAYRLYAHHYVFGRLADQGGLIHFGETRSLEIRFENQIYGRTVDHRSPFTFGRLTIRQDATRRESRMIDSAAHIQRDFRFVTCLW